MLVSNRGYPSARHEARFQIIVAEGTKAWALSWLIALVSIHSEHCWRGTIIAVPPDDIKICSAGFCNRK